MDRNAKIYVAGHRGLVGSALVRALREQGFDQLRSSKMAQEEFLRLLAETSHALRAVRH